MEIFSPKYGFPCDFDEYRLGWDFGDTVKHVWLYLDQLNCTIEFFTFLRATQALHFICGIMLEHNTLLKCKSTSNYSKVLKNAYNHFRSLDDKPHW